MLQIYLNGRYIFDITIHPQNTIRQVKETLHTLLKNPLNKYTVTLNTSDKREISPEIFATNQYDNYDFSLYSRVLDGGSIFIVEKKQEKQTSLDKVNVMLNQLKISPEYVNKVSFDHGLDANEVKELLNDPTFIATIKEEIYLRIEEEILDHMRSMETPQDVLPGENYGKEIRLPTIVKNMPKIVKN